LRKGSEVRTIRVSLEEGETIAWLHANGEVVEERYESPGEAEMDVRLSAADWARFTARQASASR
jgi:GTP-binding protein HflX